MDGNLLQNAKKELAAYLAELAEKRANPFKGTALEALTPEIRALRVTHRLAYKQIAERLLSLKIETSEEEVSAFCRQVLKARPHRPAKTRPSR